MTSGAWWTIGIFGAVFLLFLIALHVILLPGLLVILVLYESVKPRRGVVVTTNGIVEFRVGGFRALPLEVGASADRGVLDRASGRDGNKVALIFGSEAMVLRDRDHAALLSAASHLPGSTLATPSGPPVVPPPPSAYDQPAAVPPPSHGRPQEHGF